MGAVRALVALSVALAASAQVVDYSQAAETRPYKVSFLEPGACNIGDVYYNIASDRLRFCIAANSWVDESAVSGSGGGGGSQTPWLSAINGGGYALSNVASVDGAASTALGYLDATSSVQAQLNGKQASLGFTPEPALGNPATNGYVLASTTGGSRSWVAQSGGISGPTFTVPSVETVVASPAAIWLMQAGSGNSFADTSGNANTATAGGTVVWGAGIGKLTSGAHFDGTFATPAASYTAFNPSSTSPWSASTWVSFDNANNLEMLLSQTISASTLGWYIYKDQGSSANDLVVVIASSSGHAAIVNFAYTFVPGMLYHIVTTYNGSGHAAGISLYVNGSQQSQGSVSLDNAAAGVSPNVVPYLGSEPNGTAGHVGYQSNTRLYNHVLSFAEVQALWLAGPMLDTYTVATRTTETVYGSSFAALDADCVAGTKLGGGTATDNTAKLQAILNTASQTTPLDLVMDGCSVETGLTIPPTGYTTVRGTGWNTGLYVTSGSNAEILNTGVTSCESPGTPPAQGANVMIKDMTLNGNRAGNSTSGDLRGSASCWLTGLDLQNIAGLLIDHVQVLNTPTYGILLGNVTSVHIDNSSVTQNGYPANTDCLHLDGPDSDISVDGFYCYSGDDAIALNAPEGYGGPISGVNIDNMHVAYGASIMRAYSYASSSNQPNITGVNVNNVVADRVAYAGFVMNGANDASGKTGLMTDFNISNVTMVGYMVAMFGDPVGNIKFSNVTWHPVPAGPAFAWNYYSGGVGSLTLNNFKITRSSLFPYGGTALGWLLTVGGAGGTNTLGRLDLNGVSVENELGQSYSAIPYLIDVPSGQTLSWLWVSSLDPSNITSILSTNGSTNITKIQGPGVTAAGLTAK